MTDWISEGPATNAPTVRLAPVDEVAAEARKCELLRSVRRLAEWVGPKRKITKDGRLTLADARKVVRDLMLPGDQGPDRTPARSAADFEELDDLWHLALGAELLSEHGQLVRPGPALTALRNDGDDDVVGVWCDLLGARLDQMLWSADLSQALVPVLMSLYAADEPISTPDLCRVAVGLTLDLDPDEVDSVPLARAMVAPATELIGEFVGELAELDAVIDADGVAMTSLGRHGVHAWLESVGVSAPAVSDPAEAAAADIVELGFTTGGDEMEAMYDAWVAARGPERAANQLLEYAAHVPDQQSRVVAVTMADSLGTSAAEAFRGALQSDVLRPHARAWLYAHGLDDTAPELRDLQWLFVDALAPMLQGDEDEVRSAITESTKAAPEHLELVASLWQCDHPRALEVLEALGAHHAEPEVARAARKAALKARSGTTSHDNGEPRRAAKRAKSSGKPRSAKARAKARTATAREAFETSVCQLKITLLDVRPPIWRRITVPATICLPELHSAVQIAMGWTDSHLHEFEIDGRRYGEPNPQWPSEVLPESGFRLIDLVREGGEAGYLHDFGDGWRHTILLEKLIPGDAGVDSPACSAGRRACPPEDSGGPWGYDEKLAAYGDPGHPEHLDAREWLGDDFDPEQVDLTKITAVLRTLMS